jgi:hypothetical protein
MIAALPACRALASAADHPTLLTTTQGIRMKELPLLALSLVLAAAPNTSFAQNVPNADAAREVRTQYLNDLDSLQSKLLALAEAIPADKYSWRPAPGVRSVGEAFMHSASEFYTFAPAAYGAERSPVVGRGREGAQKFEAMSSKADVLKHLKDGLAYTKQAIGALPDSSIAGKKRIFGADRTIIETSFAVVDDLHEHLGQLIAYSRMIGVTPPWSK